MGFLTLEDTVLRRAEPAVKALTCILLNQRRCFERLCNRVLRVFQQTARAFSDPTDSECRSRSLVCRSFFDEPGVHPGLRRDRLSFENALERVPIRFRRIGALGSYVVACFRG